MGNKYAHDETIKYKLDCTISVDGVTSEADIVGALFGQTEGLLDQDMELKQLQKTGRIGRIHLDLTNDSGRTTGKIEVPSSLNKIETAIIAATLESVDRVGPCTCEIKLDKIVDVRKDKRDQIAKRASEIMKQWDIEQQSKRVDLSDAVEKDTRKGKVVTFGPDKLPAGPDIFKSHDIILVEGRADVVNLLKMGIENTIALEGTKVPTTIKSLCKNRKVTALLDGDKGGDMILKELALTTSVEFVARAPFMKEIEDLTINEVQDSLSKRTELTETYFVTENMKVYDFLYSQNKLLVRPQTRSRNGKGHTRRQDAKMSRNKRDIRGPRGKNLRSKSSKFRQQRSDHEDRNQKRIEIPKSLLNIVNGIKQSMSAVFVNDKNEKIVEVPTSQVFETLQNTEGVDSIIIDGVITQRLLDLSNKKSVKLIAGAVLGELNNKPEIPAIATFNRI